MSDVGERLDEAVRAQVDALREEAENGDTGVVTSWALVAHTTSFGDDGHPQSAYYLAYQNGSVPDHVAIGLFEMGKYMVQHGEVRTGDE